MRLYRDFYIIGSLLELKFNTLLMKEYTISDVEISKYEDVKNGHSFIDNGFLLEKDDAQWATVIKKLEYWDTDEWLENESDEGQLQYALENNAPLGYGDNSTPVSVYKVI